MREGEVLAWQRLRIDETGRVTEFSVTNASGAPQKYVDKVEKSIKKMQFMPGFVDRKPVPMMYIEPTFR